MQLLDGLLIKFTKTRHTSHITRQLTCSIRWCVCR